MEVLYVAFGLFVAWMIFSKTPKKIQATSEAKSSDKPLTDEAIEERQQGFEKHFLAPYVPDSLGPRDAKIYNMVKMWRTILEERHSHDQARRNEIRTDWYKYLYLLDEESSCSYLSFEGKDEEEVKNYSQRGKEAYLKRSEIENRFAQLLGEDSMKDLATLRGESNMRGPTGKGTNSLQEKIAAIDSF